VMHEIDGRRLPRLVVICDFLPKSARDGM